MEVCGHMKVPVYAKGYGEWSETWYWNPVPLGGDILQVLSPKSSRCICVVLHCFLVLNYFNNTWAILCPGNTICSPPKCHEITLYHSVVRRELRFSKPSAFLDGQCISEPFRTALTISLPGVSVLLVITTCIFWNFTCGICHCYKHLQYVLCCLWQSITHFTWMAARRLPRVQLLQKRKGFRDDIVTLKCACFLPSSLPAAPTLTLPLLPPQKRLAQHVQHILHFLYYRTIIFYCIIIFYCSFSPVCISSPNVNNYLNLQQWLRSSRVCNKV